jgi:acyl carrier protein
MNSDSHPSLQDLFAHSLGIEKSMVNDDLAYRSIPEWDSVGHMALVAAIENEFDIMLDTNDILDMSSLKAARDILVRHNIVFTEPS